MDRDEIRKIIISVIGAVALLGALGIAILLGPNLSSGIRALGSSTRRAVVSADTSTQTRSECQIYVTGAVIRPGVYTVQPGSRINDVVKLAGGLAPRADPGSVNLAARLEDGMHLRVPFRESPGQRQNKQNDKSVDTESNNKKININTSKISELCELPGIGPGIAKRIIDYRDKKGPFVRIEDIRKVSGIGAGRFEAIKELISVAD